MMVERITKLCVVVLVVLVSVVNCQVCPSDLGWENFGDKCYKFVAYPRLVASAASAVCQEDGATLVSINTPAEHVFIRDRLQAIDARRDNWLTSGVTTTNGIRWQGDGSVASNLDYWLIPEEIRNQNGFNVVYHYSGATYGWMIGNLNDISSFICEINRDEVYRIVQEHRDFDYGLNVDNPGQAPRGPTFLQEPQDTVILGATTAVYLECLATGNPDPTYEWFTQNSEQKWIKLPSNPRYSFTTGRLEITNPVEADENAYQCKASNEYGTILSNSVRLSLGRLDEFQNVQAAAVNGIEYDGVQLECPPIYGRPAKSYQWYKNDITSFIRPNAQTHTFISANGRLYFSELAQSDIGTYYCVVSLTNFGQVGSYVGSQQTEIRISLGFDLTVASGGARQFQPKIQNDFIGIYPRTPMRGGTIWLECFAYGTGPLSYSWSRDNGRAMPPNHKFDSANRILILENVGLEDGGQYACSVYSTTTKLSDRRTTELRIQARPYFTYPLTAQHVDVGSRVTWHCEAQGQPLPTYRWYKNGEVLASSPSSGITVNKNTLIIANVTAAKDNGMYQCAATNDYGTSFSSAQLRVLELAPSFIKKPMVDSMAAALGGNVTILCEPWAAPRPTYRWQKDNSDLGLVAGQYAETDHYKLLLNGNLVIFSVQAGDQGKYTCIVENKLGNAQDSTSLKVLDRTVISQRPRDEKVEVNLTATLLCQASSSPAMDMIYVWTFNDHPIDFYIMPEYRLGTGTQKGYLYVIATQFKNEGRFTCTATTGVDQASAEAYLTVLGPPGEPAGVRLQIRPMVESPDPNHPDNLANPNTTRWIIWTDGQDRGSIITHYFIEFQTSFDSTWRVHPDGNNIPKYQTVDDNFPDKRYARLTNLKAGAGVSFRVKARNSFGIGPHSLPTPMEQIPGTKPSQLVKNVRGGGGSVGDLTIVWDPLAKEDYNGPGLQYKVSWRAYEAGAQSDTAKWRSDSITHDKACSFIPDFKTGLVHMCRYVVTVGALQYYKPYETTIQAFNIHGYGPVTSPEVIMSAEDLPIGAPQNVQAVNYNATALLVTWDPVPNDVTHVRGKLKGYKISYWHKENQTEEEAKQNIIELKPGQENLAEGLIIGLQPVTWYRFTVQAYNSAGNGPKTSAYEQETFLSEPTRYPTEVHVFSVEGMGVRVFFRGVSTQVKEEPLAGYKVHVWQASDNIHNAREIDFGKSTTGVIWQLNSSILYELRVFAYSRGGQGKRSSPTVYFTVGGGQLQINSETMEIMNGVSSITASLILSSLLSLVASVVIGRLFDLHE